MEHSIARYETKFVLEDGDAERLAATIRPHTARDPWGDAEGAYAIATRYYDTPDWAIARRTRPLPKLRLRTYERGAMAMVELKESTGPGSNRKFRLPLPCAEALNLLEIGAWTAEQGPVARRVRSYVEQEQLSPSIAVAYLRVARGVPDRPVRITFDRELSARFVGRAQAATSLLPGRVIVEVKLECPPPTWLLSALRALPAPATGFSKYRRAVAELSRDPVDTLREPTPWTGVQALAS